MMSKPSRFPQRHSPIIVQRQRNKKMVCHEENLTRQLSNISNNEGYHGGESASVPFVWESEPGTPKVRVIQHFLPPLTPPPSYQQMANTTKKTITKAKIKDSPKATSLFQTIFSKRGTKKPSHDEAPPLSYSSFSSSSSSSSPRRISYSLPSSPMRHSRKGEDQEDLYDVPRSSLCFGNAGSRGSYSSMFKKIMLGDFM